MSKVYTRSPTRSLFRGREREVPSSIDEVCRYMSGGGGTSFKRDPHNGRVFETSVSLCDKREISVDLRTEV